MYTTEPVSFPIVDGEYVALLGKTKIYQIW